MDGAGPHEGRVEIRYMGKWGTVCDNVWDDLDARVVCRTLNMEGGMCTEARYRHEVAKSNHIELKYYVVVIIHHEASDLGQRDGI